MTPDKTAVIATDCTVDYKTFWKYILGANQLLKEKHVKQGDRIVLEASHTVEYLTCCFAIHLLGAACVPVEKNAPENRIYEIANEVEASLVLTGKNPLEILGGKLESLAYIVNSGYEFPSDNSLQDIVFTTGTTGKSKGVMITHREQMNISLAANIALNYGKDNIWMIPTPMNHGGGIRRMYMSLVRGSTVLLQDGFRNLKLFFDNMQQFKVTSVFMPPTAVHTILSLAGKELAKYDRQLDFLYSSGDVLQEIDKQKLNVLLPNVRKFDVYSSSEAGDVAFIDYNKVKPLNNNCVGKPYPGVEFYIVDENYHPIKSSKENPGIIAVKSDSIMSGYWKEPELTKETVKNGIIYMADLGYVDEDGKLYLLGRRDDVINIGGLKVAPSEVEDVALHFPKISECVCVPYNNKIIGLCIKMYVVLKEGCVLDKEEIADYLKTKLEAYKIPKMFECVDSIPKTFNGKIDRKRIVYMANSGSPN